MTRFLLPLSLLLSFSTPAFAVYKCESNGVTSYGDLPCQGKTLNFAVPSTTSSEALQAKQQVAQEKKELIRLENLRHKQEAQEERESRQANRIAATKRKTCAKLAQHVKWSEEDALSATGKSIEKAKRKARHNSEKYALECKTA